MGDSADREQSDLTTVIQGCGMRGMGVVIVREWGMYETSGYGFGGKMFR